MQPPAALQTVSKECRSERAKAGSGSPGAGGGGRKPVAAGGGAPAVPPLVPPPLPLQLASLQHLTPTALSTLLPAPAEVHTTSRRQGSCLDATQRKEGGSSMAEAKAKGDDTILGRLPEYAVDEIKRMLGLGPEQIDTILQLVSLPENGDEQWWT